MDFAFVHGKKKGDFAELARQLIQSLRPVGTLVNRKKGLANATLPIGNLLLSSHANTSKVMMPMYDSRKRDATEYETFERTLPVSPGRFTTMAQPRTEPFVFRAPYSLNLSGVTLILMCLGSLTACATYSEDTRRPSAVRSMPAQGSPADVLTPAGVHDGYRVSKQCRRQSCVGVVASDGSRQFVGDDQRVLTTFRAELLHACSGLRSLVSSGIAGACDEQSRPELVMWLYDWHEVDGAITCVGRELVRTTADDTVSICVGPHSEGELE